MNEAHRHACPSCHQRPLCREDCTVDVDEDGSRRGHATLCDACAARPVPVDSFAEMMRMRDEALAKYDELQEAARALLEAMPFDMSVCPKCRGNVLATKVCRFDPPIAGSWFACDEHATPGAMDSRTAPHVRRLRALLDASADLSLVQRFAGHASPTTTARYDRRPHQAVVAAVAKMDVPYEAKP